MSLETELRARAENKCELCGASENLNAHVVGPQQEDELSNTALVCTTCSEQIAGTNQLDSNHWQCLNESAWSQEAPVQVLAWRMLTRLSNEAWAAELLDMLYLDEETISWAKAGLKDEAEEAVIHKDTNGTVLSAGDTVTLIKDLKVKGAGFTAKRGTAVRNITLVPDNAAHIEGRVNDQRIVILTEFVKKN